MYLLGNDGIVTTATEVPCLVSEKMEQLVMSNFETINAFEEATRVLGFQKVVRSVEGTLLNRFEELINKVCSIGFFICPGCNVQLFDF